MQINEDKEMELLKLYKTQVQVTWVVETLWLVGWV